MDETIDKIKTIKEDNQKKDALEKLLKRREYLKERQTRFLKRKKLKDAAEFLFN